MPHLTSGGQNVAQPTEVGTARAPANDYVAAASSEDLLDVEVEIGKRGQIHLEELARALVSRERRRERIRFPRRLRIEPLDEALEIVRVPRREDLSSDMEVVLFGHGVLLRLRRNGRFWLRRRRERWPPGRAWGRRAPPRRRAARALGHYRRISRRWSACGRPASGVDYARTLGRPTPGRHGPAPC